MKHLPVTDKELVLIVRMAKDRLDSTTERIKSFEPESFHANLLREDIKRTQSIHTGAKLALHSSEQPGMTFDVGEWVMHTLIALQDKTRADFDAHVSELKAELGLHGLTVKPYGDTGQYCIVLADELNKEL